MPPSPTVHDSVISYHDAKVTGACGADYKLCCPVLRNLIMHAAVFQRGYDLLGNAWLHDIFCRLKRTTTYYSGYTYVATPY
jgi:hypothetical protein